MPDEITQTEAVEPATDPTPEPEQDSILDIYNEVRAQVDGTDTQEPEQPQEPDEPEPAEEVSDGDPDPDALAPEADDDDLGLEVPPLDDSITDPKAIKRWDEQWKGLLKREAKITEREESLTVMDSYMGAFTHSPEEAQRALLALVQGVAQMHDLDVKDFLPALGVNASDNASSVADDDKWVSDGERELNERLAQLERDREEWRKEKESAKQKAAFTEYVEQVLPRVSKAIAKKYVGFEVNKEMLTSALTMFPQFKNDPIRAVTAFATDDLVKHQAKLAAQTYKRVAPEMAGKTNGAVQRRKSPSEMTAAEIYLEEVKGRA